MTAEDILKLYIEKFVTLDLNTGVRRKGLKDVCNNFTSFREILEALYYYDDINEAAKSLHWGTGNRASSNPDRHRKGMEGSLTVKKLGFDWRKGLGKSNTRPWRAHIQQSIGYNTCSICGEIKPVSEFKLLNEISKEGKYVNDIYRNECHDCYSVKQYEAVKVYRKNNPRKAGHETAKRRARKLQRTPAWADMSAIKNLYDNCPKGYHVDHIIPLNGKLVSGLHVLENLQYLTAKENLKKSNKFDIEGQ